ncbi:MAG: sigma-70 family RNA polymerase sigma factor [Blastocatellia bacterium]
MAQPSADITQLLIAWSEGDREALDRLTPLVYDELHRLAESHMRREGADHTLQATALVNEAFLRLTAGAGAQWQNRIHFFGVASNLMRQILVEHARRRGRIKRGGDVTHVTLDEAVGWTQKKDLDLIALDDALLSLEKFAPRQSRIVELRFFGGLTEEEIAALLGVATITVKRDWRAARNWLYLELSRR